jgi:hypothetical protein
MAKDSTRGLSAFRLMAPKIVIREINADSDDTPKMKDSNSFQVRQGRKPA